MAYKTIATFISDADEMSLTLPAAADFAQRHDAHLALCALGIDTMLTGGFYMDTAPVLITEALGRAQTGAEALVSGAARLLPAQGLRWSAEPAVASFGGLVGLVGLRARFADLVIQALPYGEGARPEQAHVLEAALFEGRAPVLAVPGGNLPAGFGERIVVAWNQTNEAMSAIRAALPLLKAAERVSVAIVNPPAHGSERSDPGGMLTQMLARHGVRAEVAVLAQTLPRVSEVLARHMADSDATLLVMGAYGHSRLREAILGGATRNLLEGAQWPVFLAH